MALTAIPPGREQIMIFLKAEHHRYHLFHRYRYRHCPGPQVHPIRLMMYQRGGQIYMYPRRKPYTTPHATFMLA